MHVKLMIAALTAVLTLGGCVSVGPPVSGDPTPKRHELKDGSTLVVDADGRMRMFNLYREPIYMKDGVAMELKDGTLITMKENVIWKQLRTRGTLNPRN